MQESTILAIFLDVFGAAAMGAGIIVAVGAQSKLRTAESRRKALQARLEELEKKLAQPQSGEPKEAAASGTARKGADKGADRRVADLEAALARAEEERKQLEARYEKRLKEMAAATPVPADADANAARLPRPKSMVAAGVAGAPKASKEPMTLLLASGDAELPTAMADPLKTAGYAILPAETAADAIRIARESKPAVIALDLHLGRGPDGFKALSLLKAEEGLRDIPVVLICPLKDRERAVELGAAGCVAAPATPNVLIGALNAALVAHKKRAERSRMAQAAKNSVSN